MRQIVLDTETTGLEPSDGHRIIEIGCVELVGRRLTGNSFHQYLQPDREIDAGAMEVHGITNEFLADKPRFSDIVEDFVRYIEGAELVIHNAPFDVGFINHELKLCEQGQQVSELCSVLDTLTMTRLSSGVYQYENHDFFPLTGLGWTTPGNPFLESLENDYLGTPRNFFFTSEVRYWFEYEGDEVFDFLGERLDR